MTVQDRDPYTRPSFSIRNRLARFIWGLVQTSVFRFSPRFLHSWRVFLLRCFGARLGAGCAIYATAKIWAPWNLICEDKVAIADGVEIYNPSLVTLKSHAIVSQGAYLCGATHDYSDPAFPLISGEIELGRYSWVCARAVVMQGVLLGEGAILALGGVATHDINAWQIYGGIPAKKIGEREMRH